EKWLDQIAIFAKEIADILSANIPNEQDQNGLNKYYKFLKTSSVVINIIKMGGNLIQHKLWLSDKNNLSDVFIAKEPGLRFQPFPFSNFDLKIIWAQPMMDKLNLV